MGTEIFLIILMIVSLLYTTIIIRQEITNNKERLKFMEAIGQESFKGQEQLERAHERFQKERQDLLDRLMARDLTEAKIAQKIGRVPEGKIVSRSANTKRIIEENQKIGGSD